MEPRTSDTPKPDYLDVLVLCSAPVDLRPALNLAQEIAHFEAEVRRATVPVRLRRVFPPTFEQLQRLLAAAEIDQRRPRVFHFLGHGEEDGLWFEKDDGSKELIQAVRLRRLFEDTPICLALLNACWSATDRAVSLCDLLTREAAVETAIGHGKPVADRSAITFAVDFYKQLIAGETAGNAWRCAVNALAEKGMPGATEIKLSGNAELQPLDGIAAGERTGRV